MARRRARDNPLKTRDKFLIGGGAALVLGGILYFVTRPKEEKKKEGSYIPPESSPKSGKGNGGYTYQPPKSDYERALELAEASTAVAPR